MNATTTPAPATPAAPARGFDLTCLMCGKEASLSLDLDDLDTIRCPECEESYALADARAILGQWQNLLAWVALAPAKE